VRCDREYLRVIGGSCAGDIVKYFFGDLDRAPTSGADVIRERGERVQGTGERDDKTTILSAKLTGFRCHDAAIGFRARVLSLLSKERVSGNAPASHFAMSNARVSTVSR